MTPDPTQTAALLEMRGIRKAFGATVANDRVDLAVAHGEVHALVGENGAGKTTLMNILFGLVSPDAGEIRFAGRPQRISSPLDAERLGIGMVHQHFRLVASLTVAENLALGHEPTRRGVLDLRAAERRVRELADRHGFAMEPGARVRDLSVGQRQRVEILKALSTDARLLVLDEPTAVLTPQEADELLRMIADLRRVGTSVVLISHKLREVKAVADRVTVLRDGRTVATLDAAEAGEADLARLMVGRDLRPPQRSASARPGDVVLEADGVMLETPGGRRLLDDVSLTVRAGEIVGIAGVEGNGQAELAETLAGLRRPTGGRVRLLGEDVTDRDVGARRARGLGFVPEDRLHQGISPTLSIAENLAASQYAERRLTRRGWIAPGRLRAWAGALIDRFDVRGGRPGAPAGDLSGGNMQKVVLARELARDPRICIVAQPTRGVDVGAMEFVHGMLLKLAADGRGVLLISSELSEVMSLSDRILVLFDGAIAGEFAAGGVTEQQLGAHMMGLGTTEAVRT